MKIVSLYGSPCLMTGGVSHQQKVKLEEDKCRQE